MRHYARADDVVFEATENGWVLEVYSEDGDVFRFNVHHLAWDLAEHADDTIGGWRREGEHARATKPPRELPPPNLPWPEDP